jgi:hypothetical protein
LSLSGASRCLVNEGVKSNRIAPLSKGSEGGARLAVSTLVALRRQSSTATRDSDSDPCLCREG